MTQQPDIYSALRDHSLSDHFRHSGEVLAEEAVVLGSIIRHILMRGECINNKISFYPLYSVWRLPKTLFRPT